MLQLQNKEIKMSKKKVTAKNLVQRIRRDIAKDGSKLIVGRDADYTSFIIDVNGTTTQIGNIYDYGVKHYLKDYEELENEEK